MKTARLLKEFRAWYDLTQASAAGWCKMPIGTWRDYEQGRTEPKPVIREGLEGRIADYGAQYEAYYAAKGETVFRFDPQMLSNANE